MTAQTGANVVLEYGTTGSHQSGSGIVLEYTEPVTTRRVANGRHMPWGGASIVRKTTRAVHSVSSRSNPNTHALWPASAGKRSAHLSPWQQSRNTDDARHVPWSGPMVRLQPVNLTQWQQSRKTDEARHVPWGGPMLVLQPVNLTQWQQSRKTDEARHVPWGGPMLVLQPVNLTQWAGSKGTDARRKVPWTRYSQQLSHTVIVVPPVDPGDPPASLLYILPSRFYMSAHSIFAERVSDSAEIPLYDVTLSADAGSFAWTFSANGPDSLFTTLAPGSGLPTAIRITVDGIPFTFAVESLKRTEQFGKKAVAIGGRSTTALVGAPWQRVAAFSSNADARNAQQLASAALEFSGVGLDWGITDWLVPAGAWQHQGTPLSAVIAITEAAGGYVQSHRSDATLLVRHPYPTAPWDWGTGDADVEIAPDAVITSGIERKDGPDINAVYVSGTTQGVLALVKRTGTAGDKLAQLVADPLITHVDAARQRGLSILGKGGAHQLISMDLPVLTAGGEPGILDVGQLVQINAASPWRARVRAVNVTAKLPAVRQTLTLERYL